MRVRSLICAVLVATLVAACDSGGPLTEKDLVSKAEAHVEQGQLGAAVIELKNALQQNPKSMEASWLLGEVYLKLAAPEYAEKEFRRAHSLGVADASVLPVLARALLMGGKPADVLGLESTSSLPVEVSSQLLASKGLAYLDLDELLAAKKTLAEAARGAKGDPYVRVAQARLAAAEGNPEVAGEIVQETLEDYPDYYLAWSVLGDLEQLRGRAAEAEQAYSNAIKHGFAQPTDLLNRSMVRVASKDFDGADEDIASLRKKGIQDPRIDYAEGLVLFRQGKYAAAQPAFQKALAGDPGYWPAVFYAGATEYLLGNSETAFNHLARVNAQFPDHLMTRKILAEIRARDQDFATVERLLEPVVKADPKDVLALNLLAHSLVQQRKQAQGLDYLEAVATLQPDSATAQANLASALVASGEIGGGFKAFQEALSLEPADKQTAARAVLGLIEAKAYDKALQLAREFRDNNPESANVYLLLGLAQLANNDSGAASEAFLRVLKLDPGNKSANSALGIIDLRARKPEEAKKRYEDTLTYHPGDLSSLTNLAAIEFMQENWEQMQSLLETAIEHNPEAPRPRVMMAKWHLKKNEPDAALQILLPVRDAHPNDDSLLGLLGEAQFATGDFEGARATLSRLGALGPLNARAHRMLGFSYAQLGDTANAASHMQKVLDKDGGDLKARLFLTQYQIATKSLANAEANIRILKERTNNSSEALILEGLLAEMGGNWQKAEAAYRQVFQAQRNNLNFLRLMNAEWQQGKQNLVFQSLVDWLKEFPNDSLTRLELGNRYLSVGKSQDAIRTLEELLNAAPENAVALNNLAWLLKDSSPAEALQYAEKARAVAPNSPSVLDTAALVLLRNGQLSEAEAAIERALDKQPDNPSFAYHNALVSAASGRSAESARLLERALSSNQQFAERDAAQQMFDKLVTDTAIKNDR